jgi:predicted DNA-binding protein
VRSLSLAGGAIRPVPYVVPYTGSVMRKTSIYLDDEQADRLARLARAEGRPQAEIVREAISCYRPAPKRDRNFALAGNFERIDADSGPISKIPEDELMRGFGE